MAQLNLYVPEHLARWLKQAAKEKSQSISALVTSILSNKMKPGWDESFFKETYGKWKDDLPTADEMKYEAREEF